MNIQGVDIKRAQLQVQYRFNWKDIPVRWMKVMPVLSIRCSVRVSSKCYAWVRHTLRNQIMSYELSFRPRKATVCNMWVRRGSLFCADHLEISSRIFNKNIAKSCLGQTLLEVATNEYPWKQFDRAAHLRASFKDDVLVKVRAKQSIWFLLDISWCLFIRCWTDHDMLSRHQKCFGF